MKLFNYVSRKFITKFNVTFTINPVLFYVTIKALDSKFKFKDNVVSASMCTEPLVQT